MAFINHLASLVVDVIVNTRQFNSQIDAVHRRLNTFAQTEAAQLNPATLAYREMLAGKQLDRLNMMRTAAQFYIVRAAILATVAAIDTLIDHASKVEQGFIDIERVSPGLKGTNFRQALVDLKQTLPGISLRNLQEGLKETVQLGIKGQEELLAFGKTVSTLSLLTGTSAKETAESLGKIVNIFNIDPKNISHFANAVLALSQNFGATESELFNITERLGEFAKDIGLSAEETAALAAAMKNAGQSTEQSRTALFSLFAKLESEPSKVAEAFNLTTQQARELYIALRQNPREGIIKFLQMLQGRSPGEMIKALKDLGISGIRTGQGIIALAGNINQLKKAFDLAKTGAAENVLMQQQLLQNAEGLTSHVTDLTDAWDRFLASLGNTKLIQNTIDYLTNLINIAGQLTGGLPTTKSTGNLSTKEGVQAELNKLQDAQRKFNAFVKAPSDLKALAIPGEAFANLMSILTGQNKTGTGMWETWRQELRRSYYGMPGAYDYGTGIAPGKLGDRIAILNQILSQMVEAEKKKTEKEKPKVPEAQAAAEFNRLIQADQKKKTGRHSLLHPDGIFSGFMDLTTAWKNKVLQLMEEDKNDNPQLKALNEIWKEEAAANGFLGAIDNTLKTRTFPAVVV